MNNKTLETALLYLSGGCLVISVLEIITRGLSFAYIWLMISVILWLGYTYIRKSSPAGKPEKEDKSPARKSGNSGTVKSSSMRASEPKSKRKRK